MKTFTPSAQVQPFLEQMSRDMAVPIEGLVNQALFNWAKLHGYLEPGRTADAAPAPGVPISELKEAPTDPETTRVAVTADPEIEFTLAAAASFDAPDPHALRDGTRQKQRRVVLVLAEREVAVDGERFLIGRDVSCDLTIDSNRISRQHAAILVSLDTVTLEDLGSSNGTWYADQRIERRVLCHGDEFRFGDTAVRVEFR